MMVLLLSAALAAANCRDSLQAEDRQAVSEALTPDEARSDSCAWEGLWLRDDPSENASDAASGRASFLLSRTPGSPARSVFRHQAKAKGWSSGVELRGDTLVRRKLGWNGNGWRLRAGDMTDTSLPMWPRWLPRRALPQGWSASAEPDPFLPRAFVPQGMAAGISSGKWSAYGLSAWEAVQTPHATPWEKPWGFRHVAAGASASFPWKASLFFSETRVSRADRDSLEEEVLALGLASPSGILALDGAWSASRRHEPGGWALGAGWNQAFAKSGRLELKLRQRGADWKSSWDPACPEGSAVDSTPDWGAGEGSVLLRVPYRANGGKGFLTGESWAAWNPWAASHKEGWRAQAEWHRKAMRFEARLLHRRWTTSTGYRGWHDFAGLETGLGGNPEWRAGAYRIWERGGEKQGLFLGADSRLRGWSLRPGMLFTSDPEGEFRGEASLGLRGKFFQGWAWEAEGSMPAAPDPAPSRARWRAGLSYARR